MNLQSNQKGGLPGRVTLLAPAKINLWLHVLRRRADGYHDLDMLMQRLDLCDGIDIRLVEGAGVEVECPGLELAPGADNLAARAARLMLDLAGRDDVGCSIRIVKRIPAAAGLGGGSSDAASVMLGLNRLLGLGLSAEQLIPYGVRLGADVPFFLLDAVAARAGGVGEVLEPVENLPGMGYLLVNPKVAVPTADVFGNLGLTAPGAGAKLREFPRTPTGLVRLFHNDLQPVTCRLCPVVVEVLDRLGQTGADGVLMSGSGATVFAAFSDPDALERARRSLEAETDWFVAACRPFAGSIFGD
ncbi:MAG: 4-(cytidine 5'-diphospho)-2-C-methyl-D-erythritol kinase [Geothermobacteraceae bacterium]